MGAPAVGAVVLVRFPFSDLSGAELRPALVLADAGRGDFVLCQITSNPYADPEAVELRGEHIVGGTLQRTSFIRPGKPFTANTTLIVREVGVIRAEVRREVVSAVSRMLSVGLP